MDRHRPQPQATPESAQGSNHRIDGGIAPEKSVRRGLFLVGLQFGILLILTAVIAALDLDRAIAALFYRPEDKWYLGRTDMVVWLYRYGTIPGALLTLGGLIGWLTGFFSERLASWRPYLLLVVLTTVIAAGILVNGVLKSYWGRPRPNQTTEFGGFYTYRHVFPPGTPGKGSSFPCGHCTMGFTIAALYFCRSRSKSLGWGGLVVGLALGVLLSAARMVNGAHFFSDAVWSLGIVAMTSTALHYLVLKIPVGKSAPNLQRMSIKRKVALISFTVAAMVVVLFGFLSRRPFFKTIEYYPPVTATTRQLVVQINAPPEKLDVDYRGDGPPTVLIHAHGFGWADADYRIDHQYRYRGDRVWLLIDVRVGSYFSELDHAVEVVLPADMQDRLTVEVNPGPGDVEAAPAQ